MKINIHMKAQKLLVWNMALQIQKFLHTAFSDYAKVKLFSLKLFHVYGSHTALVATLSFQKVQKSANIHPLDHAYITVAP